MFDVLLRPHFNLDHHGLHPGISHSFVSFNNTRNTLRRYVTAIRYGDTLRQYVTAIRYGDTLRQYVTAIRYGNTLRHLHGMEEYTWERNYLLNTKKNVGSQGGKTEYCGSKATCQPGDDDEGQLHQPHEAAARQGKEVVERKPERPERHDAQHLVRQHEGKRHERGL